jgi:hypothetical protein
MNVMPRILTAATAAALVLTLSACGGDDEPGSSSATPQPGPIDKLFEDMYADYNEEDSSAQQMEIEELTAQCMAEQGFDYTPVDYSSMNGSSAGGDFEEPEEEWGTIEFAKKWGYGATTNPWGGGAAPLPSEDGEAWVDPNQEYIEGMSETEQTAYYAALYGEQPEMTEEEMESYEWSWEDSGCSGWAQHEIYGDTMGGSSDGEFADLEEEMSRMWESSSSDPRMAEIEAEWAACMSDAGYPNLAKVGDAETLIYDQTNVIYEDAYSDMGEDSTEEDYQAVEASIQEALAAITAEEIETATADFTCREEVKYTQTQQEINLEYQQEFYDAHKDELEAYAESMKSSLG